MMTQYFDALRDIGAQSNTILLPHSPSAVAELNAQLRNAITSGSLAAMKSMEKPDGVKESPCGDGPHGLYRPVPFSPARHQC